jgi:micrococcal nuclease
MNKKIEIIDTKKRTYNRYVVRAKIDNQDIASLLLINGLAIIRYISLNKKSPYYTSDVNYFQHLKSLELIAKNRKVGI